MHIDGLRRDGRLIPDERDHCQLLTVSISQLSKHQRAESALAGVGGWDLRSVPGGRRFTGMGNLRSCGLPESF